MSERIDERIMRKICNFKEDELYYTIQKGFSILKTEWSPSTNIVHAIEALECLPKKLTWTVGSGYCSVQGRYAHLLQTGKFLAQRTEKSTCLAICRALLDARVLKVVRKARREKK